MRNALYPLVIKHSKYINKSFISHILLWSLLLACCYFLAKMTWQIIEPDSLLVSEQKYPLSQTKNTPTNSVDTYSLHQLTLFGEAKNEASQIPKTLPATTLPIKLRGILASPSSPERSIAIIEYRQAQHSYLIGEMLGDTRAKIIAIDSEQVTLEQNGRQFVLRYDDQTSRTPSASAPVKAQPTTTVPSALRQQLKDKPQKIFDYLTISPVQGAEGIQGYRLNPGKDPHWFKAIGFQENDLATAINGLDLKDIRQARDALQRLEQLTDLVISVERDGQQYDIHVSLAEDAQ